MPSGIVRMRRKQKRKALQLLVLSGVVRPSDAEPRYYVPSQGLKTDDQADTVTALAVRQSSPPLRHKASDSRMNSMIGEWLRPTQFFTSTPVQRLDNAGPAES